MTDAPDPAEADRIRRIKARFVASVEELRKEAEADFGGGCLTPVIYFLMALAALTVILIPAVLWFYPRIRIMQKYKAMTREWVDFAQRAEPVMGFPLMVNSKLCQADNKQQSAGLCLISFESGRGGTIDFMADLANRVGLPHAESMSQDDFTFCLQLMMDGTFEPFRRRRLPESLTDGVTVYAVDLSISPLLLAHGYVSDDLPLIPCMAEPGDQGMITQMPYWIASGEAAPGKEEADAFRLMLGAMSRWARDAAGKRWP